MNSILIYQYTKLNIDVDFGIISKLY